jgi:hypothetical protein
LVNLFMIGLWNRSAWWVARGERTKLKGLSVT